MSLHCWSSSAYTIPLPPGHRFPIEKYALLRERVLEEGIVRHDRLHDPPRASRDDLILVHAPEYVDAFTSGELDAAAMRRIGFPWSGALVERACRAVGGSIMAAEAALRHGVGMNLAGGTHHAFADHGEGYCVFNDVAVAIRRLQRDGRISRALVIDLDVHQGNGTNAIFAGDPTVTTFDMHGRRNFPFVKVAADIDIELDDGCGDETYLGLLQAHLPRVIASAGADLVCYLAGADPHVDDRLGRLGLTLDGLARRDEIVLELCRSIGLPAAVVIAGGYGRDIATTVGIHATTARLAAQHARPAAAPSQDESALAFGRAPHSSPP